MPRWRLGVAVSLKTDVPSNAEMACLYGVKFAGNGRDRPNHDGIKMVPLTDPGQCKKGVEVSIGLLAACCSRVWHSSGSECRPDVTRRHDGIDPDQGFSWSGSRALVIHGSSRFMIDGLLQADVGSQDKGESWLARAFGGRSEESPGVFAVTLGQVEGPMHWLCRRRECRVPQRCTNSCCI